MADESTDGLDYLEDMIRAAEKIERFTEGMAREELDQLRTMARRLGLRRMT